MSRSTIYTVYFQRNIRYIWVVAIVALGANLIHLIAAPRFRGQPPQQFPTYTVILAETLRTQIGVQSPGPTTTLAARRDGALLFRMELPTSSPNRIQRTLWFGNGTSVMTRDLQHQKSTWEHLNLQMSAWHRDPGSHCLNSLAGRPFAAHEVFAQEEAISGYRAAKLTTHLPTLNATRWYAEDHGCAMIQSISDFGAGGVTEDKLVALSDGEPDSSLFATAPDLRETTPGELITGGPCSKGPKPCEVTARKFDESYNRNHALLARLMHLAR